MTKIELVAKEAGKYQLPAGYSITARNEASWTIVELRRGERVLARSDAKIKAQIPSSVQSLATRATDTAAKDKAAMIAILQSIPG